MTEAYAEHVLSKQLLNEMPEDASGRDRQRELARLRLLDAAIDEFVAHGFAGASTRRITKAAGVSSGLLFHHFPSKVDVYAELVRFGVREVSVGADAALAAPLDYLTTAAEEVIGLLRREPRAARMFVLMEYAQTHPGVSPEVDELLRENDLIAATVPVIEAGQRLGELRAGSPAALSLLFWAALQGVAQEAFARPGADLPEPEWILDLVRKEPQR